MQNKAREVWFIRHGESLANAGGVTTEASSYSLTETGFQQAAQLASALPKPELIIYSIYRRARETAEPAMKRFPDVLCEEWRVQEVQYLDTAKCAGTTQDQRREMAGEYWERWDPEYEAPGAESFIGFIGRVREALEKLEARREQFIHVFCHGYFMSAVAWLMLTRPSVLDAAAMRRYYHFIHGNTVPNCAILPVFFHGNGARSIGGLCALDGIGDVARTLGLSGL
jgi:2,3-bisphosphoglycerate-dependent phosphoglycerate mutase